MDNGIPIQAQLCIGTVILSIPFFIRAAVQDFRRMRKYAEPRDKNSSGFLSFLVAIFILDDMNEGGWGE